MKFVLFVITLQILSVFTMNLAIRNQDGSKDYEKVIQKACGGKLGDFVANGVAVTQNGCGPEFLDKIGFAKVVSGPLGNSITQCCNAHDQCYGVCVGGNGKKMSEARKKCDEAMRDCISGLNKGANVSFFDKVKNKVSAKVLFTTVSSLGHKAYVDAQTKFCKCK